jgi:hypothetical protein
MSSLDKVLKEFNNHAVGDTKKEKRSALHQSKFACKKQLEAYNTCTDYYFQIDVTTRLTTNVRHQVTCHDEFTAHKDCLVNHMSKWADLHGQVRELEAAEKSKAQ